MSYLNKVSSLGREGSPTYIGAKDYPDTVYSGYPGSQTYTWDRMSIGYPFLDKRRIPDPVALYSNRKEGYASPSSTALETLSGTCAVPSFFVEDRSLVEKCTRGWSQTLFKIALATNTIFFGLFFTEINTEMIILFIVFHMVLYWIVTGIYVDMSISEWSTIQSYKQSLKKDYDYSKNDSPVVQFNILTNWINEQPINKQKITYLIMGISFMFVWIPLIVKKTKKVISSEANVLKK